MRTLLTATTSRFSMCSDTECGDGDDERFGQEGSAGESGSDNEVDYEAPEAAKSFSVFYENMNGYKTHGIDVEASLELLEHPADIVMLNESTVCPEEKPMTLAGYTLLCQRNRDGEGGGIAVFAKSDVCARMSVIHISDKYER